MRTSHCSQTALAVAASSSSSGKNIPGSSPRQAPSSRHTITLADTIAPVLLSKYV
jgi:hypothetical protein